LATVTGVPFLLAEQSSPKVRTVIHWLMKYEELALEKNTHTKALKFTHTWWSKG
jgi:hypothetical protein